MSPQAMARMTATSHAATLNDQVGGLCIMSPPLVLALRWQAKRPMGAWVMACGMHRGAWCPTAAVRGGRRL